MFTTRDTSVRVGVRVRAGSCVRVGGSLLVHALVHANLFLAASAAADDVKRPYILWTKEEAKELRTKIMARPWAKERFIERFQVQTNAWKRSTVDNLFFYTMVGDREAYEAEVPPLMGFINAPPLVKDMTDWRWHHVDHSDMAIRFDVFHEKLTPAQRKAVYNTFHQLAVYGIEQEPLRGFENVRMMSHMFCALATKDKRLIKGIFNCRGGGKDYFDGIREGHFTRHGWNPSHRTLGQIWTWCRAVERLGMNEIGFGYNNEKGESLRDLLEGIFLLGDPRIDIPGGTWFYGRSAVHLDFRGGSFHRMPMGRFSPQLFHAPVVIGYLRDGTGGWPPWLNLVSHKNYDVYEQGTFRMYLSLVMELAHQRWPDAPFAYFLAQMRKPGADKYYPSIYFGVDAIDAGAVKPPPVRSAVHRAPKVALLRAEEGASFWESAAPYAALRLPGWSRRSGGASFSIATFHAFNRPLYQTHKDRGPHGPRWDRTGKPHSTVAIDNRRAGIPDPAKIRTHFDPLVKFVGARSIPRSWQEKEETPDGEETMVTKHAALSPGVEPERILALTREYLFDVFRLRSEKEHTYDWMVQAIGSAQPDDPSDWKPTRDLDKSLPGSGDRGMPLNYEEQHAFDPGKRTWSMNAVQTAMTTDLEATVLGPEWYNRRVGVRVTMLGEPGTRAFYARRPLRRKLTREEKEKLALEKNPLRLQARSETYNKVDSEIMELQILPPSAGRIKPGDRKEIKKKKKPFKPVGVIAETRPETGDVTIIGERKGADVTFAVLHEPFVNEEWKIPGFERVQQTKEALAVAVKGREGGPVNDRIMVALGDAVDTETTLGGSGEEFRFKGFAFVRVSADEVMATGELLGMKLKVDGKPRLVLNGEKVKAKVRGGVLTFNL